MKMWNEERGFGFISPAEGGEDVFCHRSALAEGVSLSTGASVTYEEQWDDRKNKHRANNVVTSDDRTELVQEIAYHFVGCGTRWAFIS